MKKQKQKMIQNRSIIESPGHVLMGMAPIKRTESSENSLSFSNQFDLRTNRVSNNISKILVVDDEAFNILVIKGLMRVLGMQNVDSRVDCCYNGE